MKTLGLTILFLLASALPAAGQQPAREKESARPPAQEKSDKKEAAEGQQKGVAQEQKAGRTADRLTVWEEKCDCTLVPYSPDPPCSKKCTERAQAILAIATEDELRLIVGVGRDVAQQVVAARERASTNNTFMQWEYFNRVFNAGQMSTLRRRLDKLTKPQVEFFSLPAERRLPYVQAIKALVSPEVLNGRCGEWMP